MPLVGGSISPERLQYLKVKWAERFRMGDDEYCDLYSDLSEDEQNLVDSWDALFEKMLYEN